MSLRILPAVLAFVLLLAACGGSDDADAEEAMTEEAMTEEATSEEAMSDDMADDSMSDDVADDSMSDEEMSDEEMSDEEMSDDETSDDMADDMSDDDMEEHMATSFTVTITNTSDTAALSTPLAPGAYAVHSSMDTLFAEGENDRGEGLEQLAEDGDPSTLVASLSGVSTVSVAGAFTNPDEGAEAGPALPGSTYSFTFEAMPGDYLSLATMIVQSNDWFFAPSSSGINLFDGGEPIDGDVTDAVGLWDAGTEADEVPGEGANQAPRQSGPDTGEDQDGPVAAVPGYEGSISVEISINS